MKGRQDIDKAMQHEQIHQERFQKVIWKHSVNDDHCWKKTSLLSSLHTILIIRSILWHKTTSLVCVAKRRSWVISNMLSHSERHQYWTIECRMWTAARTREYAIHPCGWRPAYTRDVSANPRHECCIFKYMCCIWFGPLRKLYTSEQQICSTH